MIETRQTTDCLNQLLTTFLDFNIFTVGLARIFYTALVMINYRYIL